MFHSCSLIINNTVLVKYIAYESNLQYNVENKSKTVMAANRDTSCFP